MVGDSQTHHDAGLICIEDLSEGVDQSVEESLMVCYSSGFPNLQRLKCACLHTAAFEVLVRLCRQCNSTHLKSLLPRHKITSWASLTKLVADHVGDFAWVVSLSGASAPADPRGWSHGVGWRLGHLVSLENSHDFMPSVAFTAVVHGESWSMDCNPFTELQDVATVQRSRRT
eukprot:Skav221579  [mRNA]  locus=scaffold630:48382:51976:- [translate_table: standard]